MNLPITQSGATRPDASYSTVMLQEVHSSMQAILSKKEKEIIAREMIATLIKLLVLTTSFYGKHLKNHPLGYDTPHPASPSFCFSFVPMRKNH